MKKSCDSIRHKNNTFRIVKERLNEEKKTHKKHKIKRIPTEIAKIISSTSHNEIHTKHPIPKKARILQGRKKKYTQNSVLSSLYGWMAVMVLLALVIPATGQSTNYNVSRIRMRNITEDDGSISDYTDTLGIAVDISIHDVSSQPPTETLIGFQCLTGVDSVFRYIFDKINFAGISKDTDKALQITDSIISLREETQFSRYFLDSVLCSDTAIEISTDNKKQSNSIKKGSPGGYDSIANKMVFYNENLEAGYQLEGKIAHEFFHAFQHIKHSILHPDLAPTPKITTPYYPKTLIEITRYKQAIEADLKYLEGWLNTIKNQSVDQYDEKTLSLKRLANQYYRESIVQESFWYTKLTDWFRNEPLIELLESIPGQFVSLKKASTVNHSRFPTLLKMIKILNSEIMRFHNDQVKLISSKDFIDALSQFKHVDYDSYEQNIFLLQQGTAYIQSILSKSNTPEHRAAAKTWGEAMSLIESFAVKIQEFSDEESEAYLLEKLHPRIFEMVFPNLIKYHSEKTPFDKLEERINEEANYSGLRSTL